VTSLYVFALIAEASSPFFPEAFVSFDWVLGVALLELLLFFVLSYPFRSCS
jgi:hypothetical protein